MTSSVDMYTSKYGSLKKLNELNYVKWQSDLKIVLRSMRAYKIVTGEEVEPPAANNNAARLALESFQTRQALAATAIQFSCGDSVQHHIEGMEDDPKEMWDTLKARLNTTATHVGRTTIHNSFFNSRPVEGNSKEPHTPYPMR
jgi:hypothetical protein